MRKELVLNEDEKKVRFKRLIQRRQICKLSSNEAQELSELEPICSNYQQSEQTNTQFNEYHNNNPWGDSKVEISHQNVSLENEKQDLKSLVNENLFLRLSGLSNLIKEVYSGNVEPQRNLLLLHLSSGLSFFEDSTRRVQHVETPYLFPEIHALNKHIVAKLYKIQQINLKNGHKVKDFKNREDINLMGRQHK